MQITPGLLVAIVNLVVLVLFVAKAAMEWQKVKSALIEHGRRLNRHSKVMLSITNALIAQGVVLNPIHQELQEENEENNNDT